LVHARPGLVEKKAFGGDHEIRLRRSANASEVIGPVRSAMCSGGVDRRKGRLFV